MSTYLTQSRCDCSGGGLGTKMCQLPEAEVDRKMRTEILQHAKVFPTLTHITGGKVESIGGTWKQRHRQAGARNSQLDSARAWKEISDENIPVFRKYFTHLSLIFNQHKDGGKP